MSNDAAEIILSARRSSRFSALAARPSGVRSADAMKLSGSNPNFSGDFQRPNLMMRENLGPKSFQQALI
jgi:hypothetical protein